MNCKRCSPLKLTGSGLCVPIRENCFVQTGHPFLFLSSPFKSNVPVGVSADNRDTSRGQLFNEMTEPEPEPTVSVSLCVLLRFHPHVQRNETEIRIFSHQSNSTKSATKFIQGKKNVSDIALLPHSALESQSHARSPISAGKVQPYKLIDVGSDNLFRSLYCRTLQTPEMRTPELSNNVFTTSKKFDSPYAVSDDGTGVSVPLREDASEQPWATTGSVPHHTHPSLQIARRLHFFF